MSSRTSVARDASLKRVLFAGGRLTGLQLVDGALADVSFAGCRADLASFYGARLERVVFEACCATPTSAARR